MQYLKYPMKTMNISQNYKDSFSHKPFYTGTPKGYPIDECGSTFSREYVYAPCDCKIKRIYGVDNNGTNTIWIESLEKVKLANGSESYATILFIHPNDDDLEKLKVGKIFKQGEKMFREGKDGQATGNHVEIQVSNKKFSGNGWKENSKGGWVINSPIKPESAFFVDKDFTAIKNRNGITFKYLSKVDEVIGTEESEIKENVQSYYPKCSYKGNSIVDGLKNIKVDSSFINRKKIAEKNDIDNYRGTAEQNIKMLNLLKNGKLKK